MTEQPGPDASGHVPYPPDKEWEPIGSGHWIRRYVGWHDDDEPHHGDEIGFIELHRDPDDNWCMGSVLFDLPEAQPFRGTRGDGSPTPVWQLLSRDPLHVEPSILCKALITPGADGQPRECGNHGWIRDGKWVTA